MKKEDIPIGDRLTIKVKDGTTQVATVDHIDRGCADVLFPDGLLRIRLTELA